MISRRFFPNSLLDKGRATYHGAVEDTGDLYRGKKSFKILTVKLEQGKTYQIDLISPSFQAFLHLEDADGNIVEENSSPNIGGNSRLVFRPERTETYRLIATSLAGYRTGGFSLSIGVGLPNGLPSWFRDLDEDGDGQVTFQQWRDAGRPLDEFRLYDLNGDGIITADELLHYLHRPVELELVNGRAIYNGAVEEAGEAYRDKKSFKVLTVKLEQGKTYQFELQSRAFQAFLYLEDADGNLLEENASPDAGGYARIVFRADTAGKHRLIATSAAGSRTGSFSLSVRLGALPDGLPPWFKAMDKNADGQVTLRQWRNAGRSLNDFRRYDLNGDGFVTADEVLRYLKKPVAPKPEEVPPSLVPAWFKAMDKDGDGQVTFREWRNSGRPIDEFRQYDLNGDGMITTDEMVRYLKRPVPLTLDNGRATYKGIVEEVSELYRGKKSYKVFSVRLEQGKTYQLDLISPSFQAFLHLEDGDSNVLAENSSPNIGGNSRLLFHADRPGIYRLIATSLAGFRTGAFTLSVRLGVLGKSLPSWFRDLDKDGDGQVTFRQWRDAGRPIDEFRQYDLNGDGIITTDEVLHYLKRPVALELVNGKAIYHGTVEEAEEVYRGKKSFKVLTVKLEQGKTYQFDLHSEAFQAFLYLEDADGSPLVEESSSNIGGNSRIVVHADRAGTIRIIATSLGGYKTGDYSIAVHLIDQP